MSHQPNAFYSLCTLNRSLLAPVIQAAASHIAGKHTELGGNICYGNTVGLRGFKQIQNLHMPKYWALTGDFHGKKKKKENFVSSHPAHGVALRQECIKNSVCLCVIIRSPAT